MYVVHYSCFRTYFCCSSLLDKRLSAFASLCFTASRTASTWSRCFLSISVNLWWWTVFLSWFEAFFLYRETFQNPSNAKMNKVTTTSLEKNLNVLRRCSANCSLCSMWAFKSFLYCVSLANNSASAASTATLLDSSLALHSWNRCALNLKQHKMLNERKVPRIREMFLWKKLEIG